MSPLTNPQIIHRVVQLSLDMCAESRARCAHQLFYLYEQRRDLTAQHKKHNERRTAEMAQLSAVCEALGLDGFAASLMT